jgi:RNA polymerase sigma factor (sigma-70 family)
MEFSTNIERQIDALVAQRGRFVRYAQSVLRAAPGGLAEDAVQNAFLRVLTSTAYFRGDSTLSTWFHRVVYRECLQLCRTKTGRIISDALPLQVFYSEPTDGLFDTYEKKELVAVALRSCSSEERRFMRLRHWFGLECKELVRVSGLSQPAVKSRIHRAHGKIRRAVLRAGGL